MVEGRALEALLSLFYVPVAGIVFFSVSRPFVRSFAWFYFLTGRNALEAFWHPPTHFTVCRLLFCLLCARWVPKQQKQQSRSMAWAVAIID